MGTDVDEFAGDLRGQAGGEDDGLTAVVITETGGQPLTSCRGGLADGPHRIPGLSEDTASRLYLACGRGSDKHADMLVPEPHDAVSLSFRCCGRQSPACCQHRRDHTPDADS